MALTLDVCMFVPQKICTLPRGVASIFSEVRTTHQMPLSPLYPTPHQGKVTVSLSVYDVYK